MILCETPNGCTCGAPVTTPRGMHHLDCAIRVPYLHHVRRQRNKAITNETGGEEASKA